MRGYTEDMTVADTFAAHPHRLRVSMRAVRRVLPRAGCGLPATLLTDPLVAAWVRAHGVTVHAHRPEELGLASATGVSPAQVVWRCGATPVGISGALSSGVTRFVASTDRHLAVLAAFSGGAAAVHLDLACSGPEDHPAGVDVVGLHCALAESEPIEWAAAAGRLLGRIAALRHRGVVATRISLCGGPAKPWLEGDKSELTAIAAAVEDAIDEGCERLRLPRPAVTLGPSVR